MQPSLRPLVDNRRVIVNNPIRDAEREAERKVAQAKALETLLSFLSPAQIAEYHETQAFTVPGAKGDYRITRGRIGNIEVLGGRNRKRLLHRLCVHPENDDLPVEDVMLSQLLHLRADEAAIVARANVHPRGW